MPTLRELFADQDRFLIGSELVTTRGVILQEDGQKLLRLADQVAADSRIDWVSITDNAGGNPMLSPDHLGRKLKDKGKNVVLHMTCKDRNRNSLESQAWKYASEGFENILALTGDYPVDGFNGVAQPVFDLDAVGLLQMLSDMNQGLRIRGRKPGTYLDLARTGFFLGCAVSPFKLTEAEQVLQYEKLRLKARAGAAFIVPQLGYDLRKSHELMCFLRESGLSLPVVGNIYLLTPGVARIFNQGLIPGCVVSDGLMERIEKEKASPDKGKAFFIDFAAKQAAAFRGLGYRGAYFGGIEKYETLVAVLEKAKEYEGADWRSFAAELSNPRPREFFLYARDDKSGLAQPAQRTVLPHEGDRRAYTRHVSLSYRFSRLVHALFFGNRAPFFNVCRRLFAWLDKHPRLGEASYFNERMWKAALFECRECGDCSLPDLSYLCPQSQCAKNQRNGPCGGSLADKCEVTSRGRACVWVRHYGRQKAYGAGSGLLDRPPVIKDGSLAGTSGWANCFLLRDHNAYQHRLLEQEREKEKGKEPGPAKAP